jgi:Flp pilus assembly protein TadG
MRQHRNREKGASLFITIAALVWIIIPMLGLFVDLGILYSVKARLQAAVDGAALAAARALNLGQTTTAQATSAQQNAVNWFYANFPNGNWATYNTVMNTGTVTVVNSPSEANLRQVTVTATTSVPTWFMKYMGFNFTNLSVTGQASRKDLVAMLVLDRSGSMCAINGVAQPQPCGANDGSPCAAMIVAAKNFTGALAAGRDQVGLLTFSDGYYIDQPPTTNFQALLGYTNESGSGSGDIDGITCAGGTGTPAAMSIAYNELYKLAEPGAMNVVMLETDGLPNTVAYNFYQTPGTTSTWALNQASGCKDSAGTTWNGGGWRNVTRNWTPGISMNTSGTGYMANVPAGAIGAFYTADPSQGPPYYNIVLFNPSQTTDTAGTSNSIFIDNSSSGTAPGCVFTNPNDTNYSDFNWLPTQDVFGNQIAPGGGVQPTAYQSITLSNTNGCGSCLNLTGNIGTDWPNTHAAALNATDNAAYNIRSNATLPAYVFVIGLGGNSGDPPDPVLLQRMANDPNGDQFNVAPTPAAFQPCSTESTCIYYPNQPQGVFIYSPKATNLGEAFLSITSQILRLSH